MRFFTIMALLVTLSIGCMAQQNQLLTSYSKSGEAVVNPKIEPRVATLLEKLKSKRSKSDHQFLRTVFNVTHRQMLKQYDQYSSFQEIFETGKYDCLTATALYSVILTDLGYEYTTIETDFHIFIIVHSSDGDVLFESTDPLDGFEDKPKEIEARIAAFKNSNSSTLFKAVSNHELIGLLFYNQSVKEFNNQNWTASLQLLDNARQYYNSSRISELENLLMSVATDVTASQVSMLSSMHP